MSYVSVSGKEVSSSLLSTSTSTKTASPTKTTTKTTTTKKGSIDPMAQFRRGGTRTRSGSSASSGLMKYWPWAAGALGLVVVVKIATSGKKKSESREAA